MEREIGSSRNAEDANPKVFILTDVHVCDGWYPAQQKGSREEHLKRLMPSL